MKTLLTITTLVFTLMFSSTSFAGWTEVGKNVKGMTSYVDFERIRKVDGFVYYWTLSDYLKPSESGTLSYKFYKQGDCKLFRYKDLTGISHKESFGGGTGDSYSPKNPEWSYPPPNSINESILKKVCSR